MNVVKTIVKVNILSNSSDGHCAWHDVNVIFSYSDIYALVKIRYGLHINTETAKQTIKTRQKGKWKVEMEKNTLLLLLQLCISLNCSPYYMCKYEYIYTHIKNAQGSVLNIVLYPNITYRLRIITGLELTKV